MTTNNRIERGVSLALAVSAIAIAASVVYRQIVPASQAQPSGPAMTVSFLPDWRELLPAGRQLGSASSPVQLIEFVDLECPACEAFAKTLQRLRLSYKDRLGVTLIHYPLPMHRSAQQAARVAECGAAEGKFDEIVTAIIDDRDSLSLNRWSLYGVRVGIRDSAAFQRCHADTATVPAIERGIAAGDGIGVRATPTVIVDGWRFSTTPTERELKETIEALLQRKEPPFAVR